MTGDKLLLGLAERRVQLSAQNGVLRFRAPEGAVDDELREAVGANREELQTALKDRVGFTQLCPLSYNQISMFFLNLLDPESPAYNLALSMRIRSAVDTARLRQALELLTRRHAQLRATFGYISLYGSQLPCQFIAQSLPPLLEEFDARACSESEFRRRAQAFYASPLDLENGPVVHAGLFIRGESEYALVVKFHHIVTDGRSLNVITRDLAGLYRAAGAATAEDEPPGPYTLFCGEQLEFLSSPAGRDQVEYWLKMHTPPAEPLELGKRKHRPALRRSLGATCYFEIDAEVRAAVEECAKKLGITPFALLLAAFQCLLLRHSGRGEVVVGIPTQGNRGRQFENTVGYFINPVALRSRREPQTAFREHALKTARELADALDHRDAPFAAVIERLGGARDTSRTPVFQVMFHLLSRKTIGDVIDLIYPAAGETMMDFGGLAASSFPLDQQEGQFDLTLELVDRGSDFLGLFKYSKDLFTAEEAEAMSSDFRALAARFSRNPDGLLLDGAGGGAAAMKAAEDTGIKVAVAATFTAEAMRDLFEYWFDRLGWRAELSFAQFNQVFQTLLDPAGVFQQNRHGFAAILIRFEDLLGISRSEELRASRFEENLAGRLKSNLDELIRVVEEGTPSMSVPLCVVFCPSSPALRESWPQEAVLRESAAARLRSIQGVYVLTPEDLFRWYDVDRYYEPLGEDLGNIPYTQAFLAVLAGSILRSFHSIMKKNVKALVLDCDGTLWDGVVGEDGADHVGIGEAQRRFQEYLLEQRRTGVVLCLCSKNHETDVWSVFDRRPEMVLKREDISFWRINWRSKSANVRELAEETGFDLSAIAFMDDNPVEREEVRSSCPSVLCVELLEDWDARLSYLRHFWPLDRARITQEDLIRSEHYRAERRRRDLRSRTSSFAGFLERLQLSVDVRLAQAADYERLSQLSVRTNQFNTTVRRMTVAELTEFAADGKRSGFVAHVRDRFGDYGLVGGVLVSASNPVLVVDSFLLSCRALGRGVEYRMAAHIAGHASAVGCEWVQFPVRTTLRNEPARAFLEKLMELCGGRVCDDGAVRVSVERLQGVRFTAGEAVKEGAEEDPRKVRTVAEEAPSIWDGRILSVASELRTADSILSAFCEWRRRDRAEGSRPAGAGRSARVPGSGVEKTIAEAWKKALALDDIGTADNFFEIGGTSILLAQIAVELKRSGLEVSMVDLFQYPTISSLARYLGRPGAKIGKLDTVASAGHRQREALGARQTAALERMKRNRNKQA